MELVEKAKIILAKIPYITLATVSATGEPWNAPVFAAYDEDYNFYFGTYRESQKAQNIRNNKNVFFTVYDSTVAPGTGEGVYIKAIAKEVSDPKEIEKAFKLLNDRHVTPYWRLEHFLGDTPIVLYKVIPKKIWMNDEDKESGFLIDFRVEVEL